MKKMIAVLAAASVAVMMTACTQERPVETTPETTIRETTPATSATEPAAIPDDLPMLEETESVDRSVFTDNFSVDSASAERYAKQIQSVIADRDLDALANMVAYPMYIGFADGGVSIKDVQELTGLGAARIFTAELMESIEGAETANLSPSKAGFSLTSNGAPNVIFGVRNGALAVMGINY